MGPDDAELIQRWQQGDAAAFEDLVRRWQKPVARFLAHMSGRGELIEDLCQEVFLRMYRAGPRYRPEAAFSTWVYTIALNVARDAGRRNRRHLVPLGEADLADPAASAEQVCQQQELAGVVARALAELPEHLRVVVALRHYEGLNFEQIARVTGKPASTIKSRFAAALTRLRVRLQQLGFGPEEA